MRRQLMCAIALSLAFSTVSTAATLFFDFGATATMSGSNYNNVTAAQDPILNALDSAGLGTGIAMATSGLNENGPNENGTLAPGNPADVFLVSATQDSLFGHSSNFNAGAPRGPGLLNFTGLDGSGLTSYSFTFFASRLGATSNRETEYAISGSNEGSVYLNPSDNTSNVASMSGVIPTAGGEISVTVTQGPNNDDGNGFFYLGAMQVVSTTVPEPATFGLMALAGIVLTLQRRSRS